MVGGAIGLNNPSVLGGKHTEDVIDVGMGREIIAVTLLETFHDLGCD